MPTGYTAGILDGKITTFPEFAKICMRAFGANMHLRDENLSSEHTPQIPSDYHKNKIEEIKNSIEYIKSLSDADLIKNERRSLLESITHAIDGINKAEKSHQELSKILFDAKKWTPPTAEHVGLKDFMINQITETIDFDCETDFYTKKKTRLEAELLCINADQVRADFIEKSNKELAYHQEELEREAKRCADANKWVADLLGSLS